jgi:UDP-2,3-diacylglucosamine pyrophosphatase LpxH
MIILSDLHLGAGDAADDFGPADGPQDTALVEFLTAHCSECIILAGDTADLAQAAESEIEAAHPTAVAAVLSFATHVLRGNHDDVPRLFGRPTEEAVLLEGTLVMHGHQFDPLNYGRWRMVGKAGSWAGGWLERMFGANADLVLERWLARRILPGRFSDAARYRRCALSYIRRVYGAERVVLGHTHQLDEFNAGAARSDATDLPQVGRYANSGTWTGGRRDWVSV